MTAKVRLPSYYTGHLLAAMPQMEDPRFERSVIYLCAHNAEGAMGLVVNRLFDAITFPDLLEQLNIETGPKTEQIRVHFGGPVESGRGFVLHTDDYVRDGTLKVRSGFALTATVDILKAIAVGEGPRHSLLALGYSGWGPGQLESEIAANGWLVVPADPTIVFDQELEDKWQRALAATGVSIASLSGVSGRA
ncbi:MAG TPA: YqgE/AlgH family protein [Alphaproteobacteria bacterium]|jgi:putative transcriptional regulator|nr:YqgE/AlgH family protein [Alphaproteobacteria bacterium]